MNSLTKKIDASGLQFYSGQYSKNAKWHGRGIAWFTDAQTFIGHFDEFTMKNGKFCELLENGKVKVSQDTSNNSISNQ